MGYSDAADRAAPFIEAEAYAGRRIIIAYSHCIAHGIDMAKGLDHQAMAVESGAWTLYRFNPALYAKGENPLKLDSKPPKLTYEQWAMKETRFRSLTQSMPERAKAVDGPGTAGGHRAGEVLRGARRQRRRFPLRPARAEPAQGGRLARGLSLLALAAGQGAVCEARPPRP